jgi:hypothetical protein
MAIVPTRDMQTNQPAQANQSAQAPLVDPNSMLGNLFGGSPEAQQALFQIGLSMMQPQQVGTTFGQNLVTSMSDGFNFLQNLEATRSGQELERRKLAAEEQLSGARSDQAVAAAQGIEREGDQRDVQNQLKAWEIASDQRKAEMVYDAAILKAAKEGDPEKKVVLEGLMKIMQSKAALDGSFDFNEMMLMTNMVEAGWVPAQNPDIVRWTGFRHMINMGMLEEPDENGVQPDNWQPVNPDTLKAIGLDPEGLRSRDQAMIDAEKGKSVAEKSGAEPRRDKDGKIIIGNDPTETGSNVVDKVSQGVDQIKEQVGNIDIPKVDTSKSQLRTGIESIDQGIRQIEQKEVEKDVLATYVDQRFKELGLRKGRSNLKDPKVQKIVQKDFEETFLYLGKVRQKLWYQAFKPSLTEEQKKRAESILQEK